MSSNVQRVMKMIAWAALIGTGCGEVAVDDGSDDRHHPRCTPTTCAAEGAECGSISDGCGQTLACGTCAAPDSCGGAGVANVCGSSADPTDPVAYWKLDDGAGTTAIDSTGNGANATLTGGPAWMPASSCEVDQCLAFDGATQAGHAPIALAAIRTVTVAFWLRWTSYADDDRLALELGTAPGGFNDLATGFMVDPDSTQGGGGVFEAGLKGDGGYNQVVFARPSAGAFHHYAFVFDKAAPADGEVTPYVDGVAVAYTKPMNAENTNAFANDQLYLMSRMASQQFGPGRLDDLRVYARALSAAEIQTLAAGGGGGGGGSGGGGKWITGFYSSFWAWEVGGQPPTEIPWDKYTHVVHSQVDVQRDGTFTTEWTAAEEQALIAARPPGKKLLLQVPDNWADAGAFPLATDPSRISTFVTNIAQYVNSRGYDGVDFDWEANVNVAQYEDLITRTRAALPDKLITMDILEIEVAKVAGDKAALIDQANIMCYDEYGGGGDLWYNAAVYGNTTPLENSCSLSFGRVTGAIINWNGTWTSPGIPVAKVGAGIPFYGRRFSGPGCSQIHQTGCAMTGSFSYKDLVTDSTRWQPQYRFYDTTAKSDYLSIPGLDELDSFNGPQYMADIVAWGNAAGLGGYMAYAIGDEYLGGQNGDARFPLSTALHAAVVAP